MLITTIETPARTELRPPDVGRTEVETRLVQCFDDPTLDLNRLVMLRLSAIDYARSMREQGLPPEKMVVALKRLLCCHGDFATLPSLRDEQLDAGESGGATKYARVLRWCIEGYYG